MLKPSERDQLRRMDDWVVKAEAARGEVQHVPFCACSVCADVLWATQARNEYAWLIIQRLMEEETLS